MAYIGRHTCLEASTSGLRGSPGPIPLVLVMYRRTDRASKTADKFGTFPSFFLAQPRRPSWAIRFEFLTNGGVQWLHMKPWTPSIG